MRSSRFPFLFFLTAAVIATLAACQPRSALPSSSAAAKPTTSITQLEPTPSGGISNPEDLLKSYAGCLKQGDSQRFWSLYSEHYSFSPGENKGCDFEPADIDDVTIRRMESNGGEANDAYFLMGFTIAGESIFRPQGVADASGRYTYAFYFELIHTDDGWRIASITTNP